MHRNVEIRDAARMRRTSPPISFPEFAGMRDKMPPGLSYPINLLVGSQNIKWKSEVFRPRVHTGPVPDRCFIGIGDEMAVSSPQLCFFQMAAELPLAKLIELGCELCSTYSLPAISEQGNEQEPGVVDKTLYSLPQLTNTKALKALTARMAGVNGQKNAARALRYVADGSASPMETILFLFLTLPHKIGGYGLPVPELNKRIDLGGLIRQGSQRAGKAFYKCDLFWADANVAIEYDSDLYHTGADRIANDSKRRFDLDALGIDVITVTRSQIRNAVEFDGMVKRIAKKLGRRLRYTNPDFPKARHELRRLLLYYR